MPPARKTVLIGTIEYHLAGEVRPSVHTTPESRDLFELMAEGAERGATELVTEVSSHGLDQGRVAGIQFDVAVFTNLTRDHLDYHQTMEKYFAAKQLLFDGTMYPAPRVAVLNAHDERAKNCLLPHGAREQKFASMVSGMGDWRAASYSLTPGGAVIQLETPAGSRPGHFASRRGSQYAESARRLYRGPCAWLPFDRSCSGCSRSSRRFRAAFSLSMRVSPSQ